MNGFTASGKVHGVKSRSRSIWKGQQRQILYHASRTAEGGKKSDRIMHCRSHVWCLVLKYEVRA